MALTVHSKVVKIGNSRGIRIPKGLLDQAGLSGDVELRVEGNKLIIHASKVPRHGWGAKFDSMSKNDDVRLLDPSTPTQWDEEEWTW